MQTLAMFDSNENPDHFFNEYMKGRIERKELEGKLFMYIRSNPRRFSIAFFEEEARDDFIAWFYPRLSRAVDHYTDQGSSFSAYIAAMVKLSAREYGLRKREHRIIERTWWNAKAQEMQVAEEEPEYPDIRPLPKKVPNPRQVLMLLLKSYYYLSDDHLEKLAPTIGLNKDELFHMVDQLRILRVQREEMINGLKERIHGQFYRCLTFEKRLQAASTGSAHWYRMNRSLKISRKRLVSMRKRLQTMRIEASNEQVALVMGVAKGTVDSNLHAVRKRHEGKSEQQGGS